MISIYKMFVLFWCLQTALSIISLTPQNHILFEESISEICSKPLELFQWKKKIFVNSQTLLVPYR